MQYGFFDWQNRFETLDTSKDPLWKLKSAVNWELFRAELEAIRDKQRKSNAGASCLMPPVNPKISKAFAVGAEYPGC